MRRTARTSTRATSASVGAAVAHFARGSVPVASVSAIASTRRAAFATLTARAASLRSAAANVRAPPSNYSFQRTRYARR